MLASLFNRTHNRRLLDCISCWVEWSDKKVVGHLQARVEAKAKDALIAAGVKCPRPSACSGFGIETAPGERVLKRMADETPMPYQAAELRWDNGMPSDRLGEYDPRRHRVSLNPEASSCELPAAKFVGVMYETLLHEIGHIVHWCLFPLMNPTSLELYLNIALSSRHFSHRRRVMALMSREHIRKMKEHCQKSPPVTQEVVQKSRDLYDQAEYLSQVSELHADLFVLMVLSPRSSGSAYLGEMLFCQNVLSQLVGEPRIDTETVLKDVETAASSMKWLLGPDKWRPAKEWLLDDVEARLRVYANLRG